MQPYQMASEQIRKHGETPSKIGSFAAGAGVGLTAGRVLPFLSSFISQNTAIRGLEKIDPRFGAFINTALNGGANFDQVKEFISDKISKSESEKSQDSKNIIQKYSDNLNQYISDLIQKGSPPLEAASKAKRFLDKPQLEIIKQIEKDYNTDFGNIVESIFGKGDMSQNKPIGNEGFETKMQKFSQPNQPQQMQQQQSSGPGQQALMQMIQQINQKLGGS